MKFILSLCAILLLTTPAFADFYQDKWILKKIALSPSTATKGDGTVIAIPGEYLLQMNLETKSEGYGYNTRLVTSVKVESGSILVNIESANDLRCGDHRPEVDMGAMGPDNASARAAVAVGTYTIVINGYVAGNATINATQASFAEDANYISSVSAENVKKLNDTIGDLTTYGLNAPGIKVTLASDTTDVGSYVVTYWVAERKELDGSTGEYYIATPELKGSLTLEKGVRAQTDCDGNTELNFRGPESTLDLYAPVGTVPAAYLKIPKHKDKINLKKLK
jgi:hypothetical protein